MPRDPIVMFENGPAFEAKSGFHGKTLLSYPSDRNPLASGYLLHPERVQGKAAEMEVFYGEGRVYLFGFKPQWRGQSHGTYKLIFNAIYDSPASSKPTSFQKLADKSESQQQDGWNGETSRVHSDLAALLKQNRAFFAAHGPQAVEERNKLAAAADQFEKNAFRKWKRQHSHWMSTGAKKLASMFALYAVQAQTFGRKNLRVPWTTLDSWKNIRFLRSNRKSQAPVQKQNNELSRVVSYKREDIALYYIAI